MKIGIQLHDFDVRHQLIIIIIIAAAYLMSSSRSSAAPNRRESTPVAAISPPQEPTYAQLKAFYARQAELSGNVRVAGGPQSSSVAVGDHQVNILLANRYAARY